MKIIDKSEIEKKPKFMKIEALVGIGKGRHPFIKGQVYTVGISLGKTLIEAKRAKKVKAAE